MKPIETEVRIEEGISLAGTLAVPDAGEGARRPAVLLIAGTGKSDRNGNGGGLNMNIYKELSDFLVSLGFVTLRYDKRGTHGSGGNYYEAGYWDFVEDAEACTRYLRDRPEVDPQRVFILGHSEGALIAPVVQSRVPVSGVMLISGHAAPSVEFMDAQMDAAMKEIDAATGFKGLLFRLLRVSKSARKKNAALVQRILSSDQAVMKVGLAKINAKWFREQRAFNVLDYFPQMHCPTLAVTGDRDIQVDPQHVHIMAEHIPGPVEARVIPEMNHILKVYKGKHTMLGLLKEYKKQLGAPLHPEFLSTLADWLRRQTDAK